MGRPPASDSPAGRSRERVFAFVRSRLLRGVPPTVREVQQAMGFRAVESARSHIDALVSDGRLVKLAGRSRGLRLPAADEGEPAVLVPLVGQVQAGDLTLALQTPDGHVAARARSSDELFALVISGDSMKNAGILPGDIAIVRRQPTAENGEIIVALVGDEATVKHLRIHRDNVTLDPANPQFTPIQVDPSDLRILGRVIEIRRPLTTRHMSD